jgi:diguanylate cyclase (GGDEF)-like protein
MLHRQRETDILCRIGGEEFVALCKRADKKTIIDMAEKLRKELSEYSISLGEDKVNVTISIGVATITPENVTVLADNIYRFADTAVYHSKENGRNRVTHYDDISDRYIAPHNIKAG